MTDSDEDIQPLVFDMGTRTIKVGFAGDDKPRALIPSVIARSQSTGNNQQDAYFGNEALTKGGILNLDYPIARGTDIKWDGLENLYQHIYKYELRFAPEEQPLLIAEAPLNPKSKKEKMTEIMFETLNVPALQFEIPALLALYASGRTTGIALDCGHNISHVTPIYDGYVIANGIQQLDLGGVDVTNTLIKMLNERGYCFNTSAEYEIALNIKEKLSYVALNYEDELRNSTKITLPIHKSYVLPDGQEIALGSERFRCAEVLFQRVTGIQETVYNSIMKCDPYTREDLFGNVVVSGGSTMFPGFADRMSKEIAASTRTGMKVKVVAPPERKISVWIGGSILASFSSFQKLWISKAEYEEAGPSIIHKKCVNLISSSI